MIKNILTAIVLMFTVNAFAQTTMTVHTASGATDYLLSDIDSITYDNGGGGSGGGTTVGGNGPAGGVVFYDKGSYTNGWRYLEVLTIDLNSADWGCDGTNITGTSDLVGNGEANTTAIVNQCSTPGTAAKICFNYTNSNNSVTYDDWFLPSIDELNLIYNFTISNPSIDLDLDNGVIGTAYWSSTQFDANQAWYISFGDGSYNSYNKDGFGGRKTRPIRAF